jgi:hypothetical protein
VNNGSFFLDGERGEKKKKLGARKKKTDLKLKLQPSLLAFKTFFLPRQFKQNSRWLQTEIQLAIL